jgi:hypothetical protein
LNKRAAEKNELDRAFALLDSAPDYPYIRAEFTDSDSNVLKTLDLLSMIGVFVFYDTLAEPQYTNGPL